jgi:glycosyltransferase involved in cell wall biosynthesis
MRPLPPLAAPNEGKISMTIKVLHAITTLEIGGAECMLLRLLEAGARDKFEPSVLALMDPARAQVATLTAQVAALGVSLATLGMPQGRPSPAGLWRLCRLVRAAPPDLLQGWMYHGSLAATIGSWALPQRPPVLWNVRHSVHDLALEKPLTRLILRLSARLSGLPQAIIYNSRISAAQHARLGFEPSRAVVIPNGFDGARFRPRPEAKGRLRAELGIDPARAVIGMVARDHPMKDPGNLVRAAALLQARGHAVHLVIVGSGLDWTHRELSTLVRECGLAAQVSLLGEPTDIADVVAGFDLAALSSAWGEGFPNVLGEAMASCVPCVATDVGDCSWVIGPHGIIVPPRDSEALASALGRLLDLGPDARHQLGLAGRARVLQHFSLQEVVSQYETLHLRVSAAHGARGSWRDEQLQGVRHGRAA